MRAAALALVLAACPGLAASESFDEAQARGRRAQEQGRIPEAAEAYREALGLNPDWAEGWWLLGGISYAEDRYADCRDAFRRLTTLQPDAGVGWAFQGLCEYGAGEYDAARVSLERARERGVPAESPILPVTQYHLAVLRNQAGDFEAAMDVLNAMAAGSGEPSPGILQAMGQSFLRIPALPDALPATDREMVMLAGRGAYEVGAGASAEARKIFDQLVERYPATPNVHYGYGVFILAADADLALENFRREIEISPEHVPARLQVAFEGLKRGDVESGLEAAEQAAALEPENFAARHAYGRLLLEAGRVEESIEELETAVRLAPDSPRTRLALSRAYGRAGRREDAEREQGEFKKLSAAAQAGGQ